MQAQHFNAKLRVQAERIPVIQTSDCVSRIHESLVLVTPQVYDCMCPWSQTIRSE